MVEPTLASTSLRGAFSKPSLSYTKKESETGCEYLINVGVDSLANVEIMYDSSKLEVTVPGYQRCVVAFPQAVDEGSIKASFKKKKRAVKIKAPFA